VNESLLTGEVVPITKCAGDSLLSGSFVVSGKCTAQIQHVGAQNFAAQLAQEAKRHTRVKSELLDAIRKITRFASFFIIPLGILFFVEAVFFRSAPPDQAIISTAAALLGMLPKGMVLLTSTFLIVGIIRLSKKRVLVQDLYAIEELAHVDVLCLDKTGTLTEGKMKVSNCYEITGNPLPIPIEQTMRCFVGAMDENNATFEALRDRFPADSYYTSTHKTPFSSDRKWSSVTFKEFGTLILGAPEVLVKQDSLPQEVVAAQMAGKRILCLGYATNTPLDGVLPTIQLAAVLELSDPVRKNAPETLAFFRREGVSIKIISGDHPVTVSQIAKQAGFEDYDSYVDLSTLHTDAEIEHAATAYNVFGRVTPGQKRQLVKALQAKGHKVAMTGDGVNDVLALKEADCSIAMASGSDASKQVSKLVLVDSDFTAIPDIVMEGRCVVNNITRFGSIYLVKTFFAILLSIVAVVTVTPFPFVPLQMTLYDFLLEGFPSVVLSFERLKDRIQGVFLSTVVRHALPGALVVFLNGIAIRCFITFGGMRSTEATAILYYIVGFIGSLAVLKACRPLNMLRWLIYITATAGFFLGAYFLADIVELERLSGNTFLLFLGLAVLCVPIRHLIGKVLEKEVFLS